MRSIEHNEALNLLRQKSIEAGQDDTGNDRQAKEEEDQVNLLDEQTGKQDKYIVANSDKSITQSKKLQISNDEVMNRDINGSSVCVFDDNTWFLYDKAGDRINFNFGRNHASRKHLDFSDGLATYFLQAQKLLTYSVWPKKHPEDRPLAANTLRKKISKINNFLDWISKRGYMRSDDPSVPPKDVRLITAEVLRNEIEQQLETKNPSVDVYGFSGAIKLWCALGKRPYCPVWLSPRFEYRDVITLDLANRIWKHDSDRRRKWEAIESDDLQRLLLTAKNYLDVYSGDLFYLTKMVGEAKTIREVSGQKRNNSNIDYYSITKQIYKKTIEHKFALNTNTGLPWYKLSVINKNRGPIIALQPIRDEIKKLIGAAIFIIFIFTGVRHGEALKLDVYDLNFNGRQLDLSEDVIAQVEEAPENAFDLIRPLFKTDPYGKSYRAPVPKIAAKAFAVLCKLFGFARDEIKTNYLIPSGGFLWQGGKPNKIGEKKNLDTLKTYLKTFCAAAEVDYQHPHKSRKSLATLIINHDSNSLELIRYLLGHRSVAMTIKYLMSLPGINEELVDHHRAVELDKVTEWVADALEGYVAGPMGDHTLQAIDANITKWQGQMLPYTINSLLKSLEGAGISIQRTPATWCMWYDIRVPHDAPCLDLITRAAIEKGKAVEPKDYYPNPEFCVPYKCAYAGHSRSNLTIAKRALRYAKGKTKEGGSTRAHYKEQVDYWVKVVDRLENGHPNFINRKLLLNFVASVNS